MTLDVNYLEQAVQKMWDLYVYNRNRYLILYQDRGYRTIEWYYNSPHNKPGAKPLFDFHFRSHLRQKYTIGVFADRKTKFICFDVDIPDKNLAKKTVTELITTLNFLGITNDFITVSWSGNKGYHVEIFFDRPISNYHIKNFYYLVLYKADLLKIDSGKVELRPTDTQGVKLPLGINWKSTKMHSSFCYLIDYANDFKEIKGYQKILNANQLNAHYFELIGAKYHCIMDKVQKSISLRANMEKEANQLKTHNLLNPNSHNSEIQENGYLNATVQELLVLEIEGLKEKGTRNSALVGLAKLYKCHYQFNLQETTHKLIEWMKKQDCNYYDTPLDLCINEIYGIAKTVFKNNYGFARSEVVMRKSEIEELLNIKAKNGKLLLFAMLVHSKKYKKTDGSFFMTYYQMSKATGFCKKTCFDQVNKLIDSNFVIALERNVPTKEGFKKANIYRILISTVEEDKSLKLDLAEPGVAANLFCPKSAIIICPGAAK